MIKYREVKPDEQASRKKMSLFGISLFVLFSIIANYSLFIHVSRHVGPISYIPRPHQIIYSTQELHNRVNITFNERPELGDSIIRVLDSNGTRIDNNDLMLGNSDNILTISLNKSKVIPGIYFVKWIVLFKDDGFIIKNSYDFSYIPNDK